MGKIVSGIIGAVVAFGVAWGMIQLLGDGSDFLSNDWFDQSHEKLQEFQSETSDKIMDSLPDPDEMTN